MDFERNLESNRKFKFFYYKLYDYLHLIVYVCQNFTSKLQYKVNQRNVEKLTLDLLSRTFNYNFSEDVPIYDEIISIILKKTL